jgi:hypothetical protein
LSKSQSSASLKTDTLQKKGAIVIIQWTTSIDLSGQLIYGIGRDISEIRGVQQNLLNSERLLNDAQKKSLRLVNDIKNALVSRIIFYL